MVPHQLHVIQEDLFGHCTRNVFWSFFLKNVEQIYEKILESWQCYNHTTQSCTKYNPTTYFVSTQHNALSSPVWEPWRFDVAHTSSRNTSHGLAYESAVLRWKQQILPVWQAIFPYHSPSSSLTCLILSVMSSTHLQQHTRVAVWALRLFMNKKW